MANPHEAPSTPRSAEASSTPNSQRLPTVAKRKPMPRKGHRKSRAGCLICKRRKVKCDEVGPACGPCKRLGLACRFPELAAAPPADDTSGDALVSIRKPLRSEMPSFTITDLRFFQHFLFAAYPNLPVNGWEVWQGVGQLAHHYDFLVHAMLGLGASHLGMLNNQGYMKEALDHRVKAIKCLNEFLNKGCKTQADADAAFGTVLSLTFQSSYMPDGLGDFLSMIRGCFVIGANAIDEMSSSRFISLSRLVYIQEVDGLINASSSDAVLDMAVAKGFCTSLKGLGPLCSSPIDLDYLVRTQRVAIFAATDPVQAYLENSHLYSNIGDLTNEEFASFIDPERPVSRLIIMHILCLDIVMTRKEVEDGDKNRVEDPAMGNWRYRQNMAALWIEKIQEALPDEYKTYGQWVFDLTQGFRFSYEGRNETWRPFLLHKSKATVCTPRSSRMCKIAQISSRNSCRRFHPSNTTSI